MATYQELLQQREQLDRQIKEAVEREKAEGISKVKALIEQYGLTASDVFSRRTGSGKSAGGKVPLNTVILRQVKLGQVGEKHLNGLMGKIARVSRFSFAI